jgi:hypothetical protein
MNNDDSAASGRVAALISGFWPAQAINAAVLLDIPANIANGRRSAEDVATAVSADPQSIFRLLRALSSLGLVIDHGDRSFSLSVDGRCLLADSPGSVRGMALHVGNLLWPAFGQLDLCVRSGAPPPGIKHGPEGFAALESNPREAAIFNQSMVDGSRKVAALALAAYDFARFGTVMDVGGGYGAVLAELLKRNAKQRGIILDLNHCASGARAYLAQEGVAARAVFKPGSFFDLIPPEADCYILKYIIHDWNDDYAQRIMARLGAAVRTSHGTVVLIERVVPAKIQSASDDRRVVQGDLTMMLWDGKERTEAEYRGLFAQAGMTLSRVVPIGEGFNVIEGLPGA